MRLPQFAAILVTSYLASQTALALAAENNSNNCDDASVNFDDGATSINSPLADDCKAVIYSQKFMLVSAMHFCPEFWTLQLMKTVISE